MSRKPVLFRVTNNLKIGGIQRRLRSILPRLTPFFDVHIVTYKERGPFCDELTDEGISTHFIRFKGNLDPLGLRKLARVMKDAEADIVHTHSFGGNISGIVAGAMAGVPVRIAQVHRARYHWHRRSKVHMYKQAMEEALLHRLLTDKVLFVSRESLDFFRKMTRMPDRKLMVLHNGIDFPSHALPFPKHRLGIDDTQKIIGYVGRIGRGKGFDFFMEFACSVLQEDSQSFTFVVIGDGREADEWKLRIKDRSFSQKILFLGSQQDVFPYYLMLDCLVFTSEPGAEGMPGVVLEAGFAGLPILARKTAPLEEIKDYYSRIQFIQESLSPLDNIHKALSLPSEDGHVLRNEFSMETMLQNTRNLYNSLLEKA